MHVSSDVAEPNPLRKLLVGEAKEASRLATALAVAFGGGSSPVPIRSCEG